MRLPIKKYVKLALFCAAATVLGVAESALPIAVSIPGGKIGIANAVSAAVLYFYGAKSAFAVSLIRATVGSLVFGGVSSLPYSVFGALASTAAMACFYRKKYISPVGISIIGAFFNNTAQILIACVLLNSRAPSCYFLYLAPISIICGGAVGIAVNYFLKYKNVILKEDKI